MSGDMLCRSGLIKQDIYHVVRIKASASTQNMLYTFVVIPIGKLELKIPQVVILVTRKRPRNFFHILFGIVAFSQDKEFHKLAC